MMPSVSVSPHPSGFYSWQYCHVGGTMLNNVCISGCLCYPIEVRKDKNDKSIVRSSIYVQRNYKNEEGLYQRDYVNFVAMGQNADYLGNYAKKGDRVNLTGRLQSYAVTFKEAVEDKDGTLSTKDKKVYKTEVLVDNIEIVMNKQKTSSDSEKEKEEKVLSEEEVMARLEKYKATKEDAPSDLLFPEDLDF